MKKFRVAAMHPEVVVTVEDNGQVIERKVLRTWEELAELEALLGPDKIETGPVAWKILDLNSN